MLLLFVSFLPFTTSLMAVHLNDPGERPAVVAFGLNLTLAALLVNVLLGYAARRPGVAADDVAPTDGDTIAAGRGLSDSGPLEKSVREDDDRGAGCEREQREHKPEHHGARARPGRRVLGLRDQLRRPLLQGPELRQPVRTPGRRSRRPRLLDGHLRRRFRLDVGLVLRWPHDVDRVGVPVAPAVPHGPQRAPPARPAPAERKAARAHLGGLAGTGLTAAVPAETATADRHGDPA